jgi:Domain of unknown function (DUF6265)
MLVLNVAPAPPAHAPASASGQPSGVERLHWMAGCWQQRTPTAVTDEQWMIPRGGAMVGMSRTIVNDRLRGWEALRVVTDSGRVAYLAQPNGGPVTRFLASAVSDTMAVFENLQHDFPQRIAYRQVTPDSLVARVSGVRNGVERGFDTPMRRVDCSQ